MRNNKITAVFLAVIMVSATLAFVTPAMAGTEIVTQPVPPVVTNVECNVSTVTVYTYYNITFDLKDNNGINTTENITVNVWANASEVNEPTTTEVKRKYYIFKWNSTNKTWYGPTYGADYVNSAASTNVSGASYGLINSTNVNVTFKLDKIALPTNATSGWKINVTVYDEDGNCSTESVGNDPLNSSAFAVSAYSELSAETTAEAGIDFGSADPGDEVGDLLTNTTAVTHIANTQTNVTVKGEDFSRSTGWGTISISQFYFNTTNTTTDDAAASGGAGVKQLTTGKQNGYTAFRNETDALGIVDIQGYTDNETLGLAFNGSLPWACRAGTYTATWTIYADATSPTA